MPDLQLELIVAKVHEILKADARTKQDAAGRAVHWHLGRMSPIGIPTLPAAGVSFAPGIALSTATIPDGRGGEVPVRIRVWTATTEGMAKAEEHIQDLLGRIMDVLWGTVRLELTQYATKPWLGEIAVPDLDTNDEAPAPYAEVTIIATYVVRL